MTVSSISLLAQLAMEQDEDDEAGECRYSDC